MFQRKRKPLGAVPGVITVVASLASPAAFLASCDEGPADDGVETVEQMAVVSSAGDAQPATYPPGLPTGPCRDPYGAHPALPPSPPGRSPGARKALAALASTDGKATRERARLLADAASPSARAAALARRATMPADERARARQGAFIAEIGARRAELSRLPPDERGRRMAELKARLILE
jgi:hypothetical protein